MWTLQKQNALLEATPLVKNNLYIFYVPAYMPVTPRPTC